jgi:hypothetical protein
VKRKERVEDKVEKSSSQPRLLEALKQMFAFSPGNRQLLIFLAIKKYFLTFFFTGMSHITDADTHIYIYEHSLL